MLEEDHLEDVFSKENVKKKRFSWQILTNKGFYGMVFCKGISCD